jgi:hypothetical protein
MNKQLKTNTDDLDGKPSNTTATEHDKKEKKSGKSPSEVAKFISLCSD